MRTVMTVEAEPSVQYVKSHHLHTALLCITYTDGTRTH